MEMAEGQEGTGEVGEARSEECVQRGVLRGTRLSAAGVLVAFPLKRGLQEGS